MSVDEQKSLMEEFKAIAHAELALAKRMLPYVKAGEERPAELMQEFDELGERLERLDQRAKKLKAEEEEAGQSAESE